MRCCGLVFRGNAELAFQNIEDVITALSILVLTVEYWPVRQPRTSVGKGRGWAPRHYRGAGLGPLTATDPRSKNFLRAAPPRRLPEYSPAREVDPVLGD